MTAKVAAVAAGFALIAVVTAGCDDVSQAGDAVSGKIDNATLCTDAIKLASFDIGSVNPNQIAETAEKKAKEARELLPKVEDPALRTQVEELATQYEQLGQQDGHGIANLGTFIERNVGKLTTIKEICV